MSERQNSLKVTSKDGRLLFGVKVVPGSSRTEIAGLYGDSLKVRLSAAPEKGKANKALIKLLSEKLCITAGMITIDAGMTSQLKQVAVRNIDAKTLSEKLGI